MSRWFRKPAVERELQPEIGSCRITIDGNGEFHVEQFSPNLSGPERIERNKRARERRPV